MDGHVHVHVHSRPTGIAVAGHSGALILGPEPGQVSKLVNAEITFYDSFSEYVTGDATRFFPQYFGTRTFDGDTDETGKPGPFVYIVLEDLTYGFTQALPLDVKMGFKTYDPSSPPEKAARQEKTDLKSTSRSLGLRLTGYKHANEESGEVELVGKDITFGISTREELENHFLRYFSLNDKVRRDVIQVVLKQTSEIKEWYKTENKKFRMYSASLLLIWDAESEEPRVRVRLIDMAHVLPLDNGERDDNVIGGMENLIQILEQLAKD